MASRRMLSRRISVSKKLNNLPVKAQLVWVWTIPFLDDFGCYTADPEDIKSEAMPKNRCIKVGDIARALRQSQEAGLIFLYEADGKPYQKYINFESFQTFRADRNRQHAYPDFDPKTAKNNLGKPATTSDGPKLVLSEDSISIKLREDKLITNSSPDQQLIFDHWNTFKTQRPWKSHNELTYEIQEAIADRLKQYTADQLMRAISNYAKVLQSPDYAWSYAWTLRQFLTRHQKPPNQSELQLYRWLDSGFAEDDYIKPEVQRRRIERVRQETEAAVDVPTDDEKAKLRANLPVMMQRRLDKKEAAERKAE